MKNLVRFCWIWFALSLCFAPAVAGLNVGTPFQDGSLLIFPKIEVSEERDTIIKIAMSTGPSRLPQVLLGNGQRNPSKFLV